MAVLYVTDTAPYTAPFYDVITLHSIGRTGRAGAKGTAYTFFTTKDAHSAKDLIAVLKQAGMEIPSDLEAMQSAVGTEKWHKGGGGKRGRGGGGGGGGTC